MNIVIRTRGFSITPGLRSHVERRVAFALDRFVERVGRVSVTIGDVNGPKGGPDKSCRVQVTVGDGRAIRATALDTDAYAALATAIRRAGRGLARALGRADMAAGGPPPRARDA